MYLSGAILGLSTFRQSSDLPAKRAYTSIKVYGNAIIDKLHIRSKEFTGTQLADIIVTDTLKWTPSTLLMCEFEDTLGGGNIANVTNSIIKWQITRKESETDVLTILDTVDVSEISYIDYESQTFKTYVYDVFALSSDEISEPLETGEIYNDSFGWFLIGTDNDGTIYSYKFDLQVASNTLTTEEDFTEYSSYTQYNAFAKGARNFVRGSISFLAGEIETDGTLSQTVDYVSILKNRIQNSTTKTLKSRKGEIWKVKTHGFSATQLNDDIGDQPQMLGFDFIECESV